MGPWGIIGGPGVEMGGPFMVAWGIIGRPGIEMGCPFMVAWGITGGQESKCEVLSWEPGALF